MRASIRISAGPLAVLCAALTMGGAARAADTAQANAPRAASPQDVQQYLGPGHEANAQAEPPSALSTPVPFHSNGGPSFSDGETTRPNKAFADGLKSTS